MRLCVPLPLRLRGRQRKAVCMLCRGGDEVPETHLWPLLDRIGIHIEVPRVDYETLSDLDQHQLVVSAR